MARDTVTVPSILDRVVKFDDCETPEPRLRDMIFTYYMMGLNPEHALAKRRAEQFIAALPSSDTEGGARGVQGSIATKQESCPESAPRTETAFHFHRFVKGQERAEGVMICKALSLQDAFYAARKLYNYPNNMDLVLAISDSEVAILRDIARTSVALSECHKEIAKLREQLLSHSTGEH